MAGLTALQVKSAKLGRRADGRGLYLIVRDSGSRSWMLRAQVAGKRQNIGIVSAKRVTLAQARAKASELREKLEAGEEIRPAPHLLRRKLPFRPLRRRHVLATRRSRVAGAISSTERFGSPRSRCTSFRTSVRLLSIGSPVL